MELVKIFKLNVYCSCETYKTAIGTFDDRTGITVVE